MKHRNKGKRLASFIGDYVVFDLETTGINQETDAIIEISAVKVRNHEVIEEFSTLVNPGRRIPKAATAVNGITDDMVEDAPDISTAMREFLNFIGESVLVGHNIHTFDTNFAYDAALDSLGRELTNDYIDTLYMARRCLPELSHHKLTDISAHFCIETEGAHRALCDCRMNQRCYEEMGKLMQTKNIQEEKVQNCPQCGNELVLRNGKYGMFYGCSGYPGCRFTKNVRTMI